MGRKSVKEMRDELSRHADELLGKVGIRDNTDCKRRFAELMSADPTKKSELDALMKQVDDSVPRSNIPSEMRAKIVRLNQSEAAFKYMSEEYEKQKSWPPAVKKGMQDFVLKTYGSREDQLMMRRVERVEKVAKGMMRRFAADAPVQDAAAPKKPKAAVEHKVVLMAFDIDRTVLSPKAEPKGQQGEAQNQYAEHFVYNVDGGVSTLGDQNPDNPSEGKQAIDRKTQYAQPKVAAADTVRMFRTMHKFNQRQKAKAPGKGHPIIKVHAASSRNKFALTPRGVWENNYNKKGKAKGVAYTDALNSDDSWVKGVADNCEREANENSALINAVFKGVEQLVPQGAEFFPEYAYDALENPREGNGRTIDPVRGSKAEMLDRLAANVGADRVIFLDDDADAGNDKALSENVTKVEYVQAKSMDPPDHFFEGSFSAMPMQEFLECYMQVTEDEMKFQSGGTVSVAVSDDVAKTMAGQNARLIQYMEANKDSIVAAQAEHFSDVYPGNSVKQEFSAQVDKLKTINNLEKYLQRPKKGSHTEVKHAAAKKMIAMLKGEKVEPFSKEEKKAFTGNVFSRLFQDFAKDLPKEFRHISPARTLQKIEAKFGVKAPSQVSSFRRAMSGERAGATATSSNPKAVAARKDGLEAQKVQKKGGHQIRTPGKTS